MKTKLITSRKWKNPGIEAFVSDEEIGARIDITDFIDALVEEVGNPATLMTKAGLKAKLEAASLSVLKELRSTTRFVA